MVLSGGMDRTLRYWNIKGELKYTSREFNGWVSCLTHIRQDKQSMLAVGSWDSQVRIFDKDYKYSRGVEGFDYGIVSMATDEEGDFLFCGEKNGLIRVHNLLEGGKTELKSTIDVQADLNAISFEDKYYMAITSATSKGLKVNEVSKTSTTLFESALGGACLSLAWDESKKYLFAGFADGGIRVYQFNSLSD